MADKELNSVQQKTCKCEDLTSTLLIHAGPTRVAVLTKRQSSGQWSQKKYRSPLKSHTASVYQQCAGGERQQEASCVTAFPKPDAFQTVVG
ncbi:hypothetical protein ACOMHN_003469 [Nucella lapillus]